MESESGKPSKAAANAEEEVKKNAIGDDVTGLKESSAEAGVDEKMKAVNAAGPSSEKTKIDKKLGPDASKGESNTATADDSGYKAATSLTRAIPRKRRRIERESLHDDESDHGDEGMDVSLGQLKRQVLGRDLKVDDHDWEDEDDAELRQIRAMMNATNAANDENEDTKPEASETKKKDNDNSENKLIAKTSTPPLSEKLRKDLICAICHEVVYPPVALPCGHTFCQPCIDWWLDHDAAGRCPTCRRSSPHKYTSPNLALKACVMAMFGPEIVQRIQNRKKARPKGENGGAHDSGYQVLSELRDETWHYVGVQTESSSTSLTIQVRRSIVLDAEDQRMQLALALYYKPVKEEAENDEQSGRFRVELCLLTMEEDEAVDSGFPTSVSSPEDEYFLCGSSRFLYTHLDVQMKDDNRTVSPLARVSADTSDGRFKYILDPSESAGNAGIETIRSLLFGHSETGLQLEINLDRLQNRAGGSSILPLTHNRSQHERTHRGHYYSDEEYYDNTDDEEDEGNQNEFEEDGFLVGDDDASHAEGAFSDESVDEGDRCTICNDGGELMVCDGGDKHPGCGKSFHAGCVNRPAIPDGDWICQACAKSMGIKSDIVGHEFPVQVEASKKKQDGETPQDNEGYESEVEGAFSDNENPTEDKHSIQGEDDDASESNEKQDQEDAPLAKPSRNANTGSIKRRFVLEDSDSD